MSAAPAGHSPPPAASTSSASPASTASWSRRRALARSRHGIQVVATILARERVQELDDQGALVTLKRPAELDPRHRVDGGFQRLGTAVVEIGCGERHVAK